MTSRPGADTVRTLCPDILSGCPYPADSKALIAADTLSGHYATDTLSGLDQFKNAGASATRCEIVDLRAADTLSADTRFHCPRTPGHFPYIERGKCPPGVSGGEEKGHESDHGR